MVASWLQVISITQKEIAESTMVREVAHERKRNPLSDLNKILRGDRNPRRNHLCQFGKDRLSGLGLAGVKVCPYPLTLIVALTTLSHYRASV